MSSWEALPRPPARRRAHAAPPLPRHLPCSCCCSYELLNEPWPGDTLADPLLLLPGVADKRNLQPCAGGARRGGVKMVAPPLASPPPCSFYENVTRAIRAAELRAGAAPHAALFEPITWDNFVPVGFDALPGALPLLLVEDHHHLETDTVPLLFRREKTIGERGAAPRGDRRGLPPCLLSPLFLRSSAGADAGLAVLAYHYYDPPDLVGEPAEDEGGLLAAGWLATTRLPSPPLSRPPSVVQALAPTCATGLQTPTGSVR